MTDIKMLVELADQLSGFTPEEQEDIIKIGTAIQQLPPAQREFIRGGAVALSMVSNREEKKGA